MEWSLLQLQNIAELRNLTVVGTRFNYAVPTEAEVRHVFELCDALWLHSGDPKHPHAELTSGKCSNGFIDTLRVLRYTNLCEFFAHTMVNLLGERHPEFCRGKSRNAIQWVIGSDHAGVALSHSVAIRLNAQHDFTEKEQAAGSKKQLWKRFAIQPGERVLQVEELITTTGTLQAVRDGIRSGNSNPAVDFVPVTMTLIHRSDQYKFEGDPILYLAHFDISTWEPSECPLCAAGSERVRPKQNWAKLNGR